MPLVRRGVCLLVLGLCSPLFAENVAVENLGVVERQAPVAGHAVSPGTKEYPPRLLIGFKGEDGTWTINLQDGTARKVESKGFENDTLQWPSLIGADGKVFTSCGRGGLAVYDPRADTSKLIRPIPDARWLRGMAIGPGGAVYVSDYPTGSAAKYDPQTGKVTRFGRQGGPFTIQHVYGYSIGCDGRYVYTAAGKIPWYVVAYDTTNGRQQNLLRFEAADHPEVHQRGGKVYLDVKHGDPQKDQPANSYFRLVAGRAEPVDAIPRFDDSYVPGNDRPQPEIERWDRNLPIVEGGAALKYRMPGQPWKTATIPVAGSELTVERIAPLADGRLLVSTGPYGNVHYFEPKSGAFVSLGNPAAKNVYDLLQWKGRLYFCGYPNGILGTFNDDGGQLIGDWHESIGSKYATFLVPGADGRIYSGNHNERESTGGGLGWYDPQDRTFGGMHFPNDDCEWLTSATNGKLIVYASDFSHDPSHPEIKPRNGQIIVFDTTSREIVRRFSPLSDGSAGVVVETQPGTLLGVGRHDKLPVMYTADIATGTVEQRIALPERAYRHIVRGPDGNVYMFLGKSLVRADPQTLRIETLCEAEPGRMAFLESDVYIAGTAALRRIPNVADRP